MPTDPWREMPWRKLALACLALWLGLLWLSPSRDAALETRVDAVLKQALDSQEVVGAVVLVSLRGRLVYHRAVGFADREKGRAMSEDTLFRLASMSKPIVSAAALALADAGKLSLDDPVTRFLPWFTPPLPDGGPAVITVRELLNQTSGLNYGFQQSPDGPMIKAQVSDGLDDQDISLEENLRRLATVRLSFAPGTQWGYSLATDVVGAVVAKAGGASLPEVVKSLVTGPLNMTDTAFMANDPERLDKPYVSEKDRTRPMAQHEVVPNGQGLTVFEPARALDPKAYPSGGAGLVGTAGDYLKFMEALRLGGDGVLKPETARAMTTNQVGDMRVVVGPGWGFGYGVAVLKDKSRDKSQARAGSWGWGGAYGTEFSVDPKAGLCLVVMTNTIPSGRAWTFPEDVKNAVYGQE